MPVSSYPRDEPLRVRLEAVTEEKSCAVRMYSESQPVAILKESESGVTVSDVIRKRGISRASFFTWRAKCGGATAVELNRLKEFEQENAVLKRK